MASRKWKNTWTGVLRPGLEMLDARRLPNNHPLIAERRGICQIHDQADVERWSDRPVMRWVSAAELLKFSR